jgi:hypothetical protein
MLVASLNGGEHFGAIIMLYIPKIMWVPLPVAEAGGKYLPIGSYNPIGRLSMSKFGTKVLICQLEFCLSLR